MQEKQQQQQQQTSLELSDLDLPQPWQQASHLPGIGKEGGRRRCSVLSCGLKMAAERWAMMALLMVAGVVLQSGFGFVGAQNTFMVGDNNGWTFPPNAIATYFDDWAKQHVFYVGDSLFFDYQYDVHNVLEVTQVDFTTCAIDNPINTYTQANATVTLDRAGYFAFICGLPSHCAGNIKLQLTVLAVGTPVPSPVAPGPATASGPTAPGPSTELGANSGGSSLRSVYAVILLGALFAGCAALFL